MLSPRILRVLGIVGTAFVLLIANIGSVIPAPASAYTMQFHCWCRDTTTRYCNHYEIDSGVNSDTVGTRFVSVTDARIQAPGTVADLVDSLDLTPARREELLSLCRDRCAEDGGKTAVHNELTYREEICEACVASPDTSCTEDRGGRKAFGAQAEEQAIRACEERQPLAIFPITLGTPIGGISQVNGLPEYINIAYRYLVSIVLIAAIVMTVYGGFRYLVGATMGDVQAGKKIILDAIVGMLIVLGAHTILSTVNPATTLLSFTPPPPISCKDLNLPDAIKNARCSSDSDCAEGTRCVEGKNYFYSHKNVRDATIGSAREAADGIEIPGVTKSLGDSSYGEIITAPFAALAATVGGAAGYATQVVTEVRQDMNNIRVCSTGQQGAPCLVPASCDLQAGLTCIQSWTICWAGENNQPGQPCDTDNQCQNGSCVSVPDTNFKVCEMSEVQDGSPCIRPNNGQSSTIFPVHCNRISTHDSEYVCAYCPSPESGQERVWRPVMPNSGDGIYRGQCKPPNILSENVDCTRSP